MNEKDIRSTSPNANTGHEILLRSGRLFDLAHPETCEITIDDIAHGLAHTCRFAGQCDGFYSVAEHSIYVSRVATQYQLAALLHDAAEAYVGDMSAPLKKMLPEYKSIEKRIERAIFKNFGVAWPAPPEVKQADQRVLAAERRVLMPTTAAGHFDDDHIPVSIEIQRLSPEDAKVAFLHRFVEIAGK